MEASALVAEDGAGEGLGELGLGGLPPELWQCVFDWVGTWAGSLGSVGRVCRAFHALALLQLNRRRLAFESRLLEGRVQWRRVECVGSPAPGLSLDELRGEDEDEELRDYFAHSLALLHRQPSQQQSLPHGDMAGPLLARYGGSFHVGGNIYDMVFSPALFFYNFDTASWHRVDQAAVDQHEWAPERRSFASMHLINKGTQILFFGGQYRNRFSLPLDGNPEGWKFYNDAFIFDVAQLAWTPLQCKGDPPHGRVGHRSVVVERKLWIFGGTYMDNDFTYHYFDDVWTLDLDTLEWTREDVTGDSPQARQSHSLCLIPHTRQAILWGGNAEVLSAKRDLNDCYILDTDAKTWTKMEYANKNADQVPCGRWCHSAFVVGRSLVVMGGFRRSDPKPTLGQVWVLNIDRREWRKHNVPLHPSSFADLSPAERASVLQRQPAFQGAAMGIEEIYHFGGIKDHGLWILE